MGKGGTKFEGEAIGARAGRPKTVYTGKEMRANMAEYLLTGRHAELESAAQERRDTAPPLPVHDPHRAHVYIDISISNKPAGRIVVELFDDIAPSAAAHLRNRCQPGADDSLTGTEFHRLMRYNAIYGGKSRSGRDPLRVQHEPRLSCQEEGCILISLDGLEWAISLDRALNLDDAHQVVGRIHIGREMVAKLNALTATPPDDAPLERVVVTRCGPTNHHGVHDDSEAAGGKEETREAAAAAAQLQSAATRSAVLEALEVGLQSHKRKAPAGVAGPSTSGATAEPASGEAAAGVPSGSGSAAAAGGARKPPVAGAAAPAASGARNVKARVLDSMLGAISSDSDDSS